MRPRLRLFIGADEQQTATVSEPEVSMTLEELTRILADAIIWDRSWLQDFAYRIHIQWWMFALAGLLALAIAFFTVSFQSVKAALTNPVKSLRSE